MAITIYDEKVENNGSDSTGRLSATEANQIRTALIDTDERVDDVETDIAALEAADVSLDTRLDTAEADINAAEASIAALVKSSVITCGGNIQTTATGHYLWPLFHPGTLGTTEVAIVIPFACTIRKMRVFTPSTAGGATCTLTLRKNGSNTSVTCSIAIGAGTASDLVNTASFAAGDRLSVFVVQGGGASVALNNTVCSFELVPT
jgi:hypothetical protein